MNVELFLSSVAQELKAIKAARKRYAVYLSPEFNCFDYILPDEMRLSKIMADLLNPDDKHNKHAQGGRFLASFLHQVELDHWNSREDIKTKTEVRTSNIENDKRRLDIEIQWSDRTLVIENKPWADDQFDQLKDYIEDLQNSKKEWHLVYLCGTKREPSNKSIKPEKWKKMEEEKKVCSRTYENLLIPWLNNCMTVCEAERFRWFLGEFKKYVEVKFKGERDMSETKAAVEQALKSKESLEAAWQVSMAMPEIKKNLLEKLHQDLDKCVKEKGWKLQWDQELKDENTVKEQGFYILFELEKLQPYRVGFQFQDSRLENFGFGIVKEKKEMLDNSEITKLMGKADLGPYHGKPSLPWWPWLVDFEDDLRSWKTSNLAWLKINDGTLVTWVMKVAETCYKTLGRMD